MWPHEPNVTMKEYELFQTMMIVFDAFMNTQHCVHWPGLFDKQKK